MGAGLKAGRSVLLLFLIGLKGLNGQLATLLGGAITWRLDDDFESSRNITFTMKTTWDRRDFAYTGSGQQLIIGRPVVLPAGSFVTYASKFGLLKVMMGYTVEFYDNVYNVQMIDGDIVEGWFTQTVKFPVGAFSGNASIVDQNGVSLRRSQVEIVDGAAVPVVPSGGLEACPEVGPAPTPCEKYLDGASNPNPLDLFSTITLPRPEDTSRWREGKILNRNSPSVLPRFVMYITSTIPGWTNEIPFPVFDRDGDRAVDYPGLSSQFAPGTTHLTCSTGTYLTTFGCNGQQSPLDLPPYDSTYYRFSLAGKTPSDNVKFYYSFTIKATDGSNVVSTELVINFCKPEVTTGESVVLDRVPEMVTVNDAGVVVRERPASTFLECTLAGPCSIPLYAAKYNSAGSPDPAVNVSIVVDGPTPQGRFVNFSYGGGRTGVTSAAFVVGSGSTGVHGLSDIGAHKVVCFVARGWTPCRSPPQCYTVKIRGNSPFFLPPTPPLINLGDDLRIDEATPAPVCAGFTVSFAIRAADPDFGDLVRIYVTDETGDGQDLFLPPYRATKLGTFNGTTPIATVEISYTLDYNADVVPVDPVTRAISFAKARLICSVASDNTRIQRLAYGNPPEGDYRSGVKCHQVTFSGPPVFITTEHRYDGSPFNAMEGTVEERTLIVDAWAGQTKEITLRAQDPNTDAETHIVILNDPGVPSGMIVGPSECEPQVLFVPWNTSGIFSPCSVARRKLTWTPLPSVDLTRLHRVCAISRDSTPLAECAAPKMTAFGWYGEEHCVDVRVVIPAITWTAESELGQNDAPVPAEVRSAFVPCDSTFILVARDSSVGRNNTGHLVDSPYALMIQFVGDVPGRVSLESISIGREVRSRLVYAARRGDEGRNDTVCFTATDTLGLTALPASCVTFQVRRCVYCVKAGGTLEALMRQLTLDFNWLRLWAANGNEDGDPDTVTALDPDVLPGGQEGTVAINIGSIYTVERGDSLLDLAALFQTTVIQLLEVNPDLERISSPSLPLPPGQEMCVIPCTRLPLQMPELQDPVPAQA
mmetsp:Transcript_23151/g.55043  ORF Transcript_23151/g.55043 Transcript_23151/m.55043 type:complete len:1041 (-) Transcript_23151:237-3359(-)